MGGQPPHRVSLPQAGVGLPDAARRSGLPGLLCPIRYSRLGSHTSTNTGCAWLACQLLPACPEENQGKLLTKLLSLVKQWEVLSLAVSPGTAQVSQMGGFVQGGRGREGEQSPVWSLGTAHPPGWPQDSWVVWQRLWLWAGGRAPSSEDRWAGSWGDGARPCCSPLVSAASLWPSPRGTQPEGQTQVPAGLVGRQRPPSPRAPQTPDSGFEMAWPPFVAPGEIAPPVCHLLGPSPRAQPQLVGTPGGLGPELLQRAAPPRTASSSPALTSSLTVAHGVCREGVLLGIWQVGRQS